MRTALYFKSVLSADDHGAHGAPYQQIFLLINESRKTKFDIPAINIVSELLCNPTTIHIPSNTADLCRSVAAEKYG